MKTFIFLILFFASSVFAQEVWHYPPRELPDNVKEWVHLEVKVNAGSSAHRTGDPLRLEYVEIPVKDLNVLEGLGLRGILRSSLAFTRQGERYIRWIFNPEDKLYKGEILKELERISGQKPKIKNDRFIGYLTASRSVIVQDAVNGAIFSLKASTNFTGGNWHDKKMNSVAARISKAFNDFIFRNQEKDKLKNFVALGEPLAVILPGIDISFTIRDYPIFSNSKIRVLPFFSALHPTFGKEFAEQRGEDPVSYWKKHLVLPWARAMGEGLAHYGFYPNSAHTQDFLMEMDQAQNPTGRVYVRDIMDSDADRMILEARGATELLEIYKVTKKLSAWKGRVYMNAVPFRGMASPIWIQDTGDFMKGFGPEFIKTYAAYSQMTQFPVKTGSYIDQKVETDPEFIKWMEHLKENSVFEIPTCHRIYKKAI